MAEAPTKRAISVSQALSDLAERGIIVSERALRDRAREIGAYRKIGREVFFWPEDLEKIMTPECSSPSRDAKARTISRAGQSTASASRSARNAPRFQKPAANARASTPSEPPVVWSKDPT